MSSSITAEINDALLNAQNQRAIVTARMAHSSHGQKGTVVVGIKARGRDPWSRNYIGITNKIAYYDSFFDEMDNDKNGKISKEEWLEMVEQIMSC